MQEWKMREQITGVENTVVENATLAKLQGLKMQEWKMRDHISGVENAGVSAMDGHSENKLR